MGFCIRRFRKSESVETALQGLFYSERVSSNTVTDLVPPVSSRKVSPDKE
jgi:hypothetical protein